MILYRPRRQPALRKVLLEARDNAGRRKEQTFRGALCPSTRAVRLRSHSGLAEEPGGRAVEEDEAINQALKLAR